MLMLVLPFEKLGSYDSVCWRHECITDGTVTSISWFIGLACLVVISIEQLTRSLDRPQVVASLSTIMPMLVDRVLKKDHA